MLAQRLGVFVEPDEVSEVWAGVTSIFRDYGYRRSRNHARLKFLIADWGPEKFREVLEKEYLGRALPDGPPPPASPAHRDHTGVAAQHDGLLAVGATTKSGRTSGTALHELAGLAERHGQGRVRLTAQQGVVVLDVAESSSETLIEELALIGLAVRPSAFHRGTIACTGIEFCKLAIVETKARAETIRLELEKRLPDFDTRSPSTSTAARTPAPGSRSPTSASRAWCRRAPTATSSHSRCTSAGRWAPTPPSAASSAA